MESLKTLVVTGASRGIGLGIAEALVKANNPFRLVLTVRKPEDGESVRKKLSTLNPGYKGLVETRLLDVAQNSSIDAFFKGMGPIDILVNNFSTYKLFLLHV